MQTTIKPIAERLAQLPEIAVLSGGHGKFEDGACAMELVSWLAGERWSDHPKCTCPVLATFVMAWNDTLPDDDRDRLLKPFLPRLIGTRSNVAVERRRATMAADWLARVHTPTWLRLAGLTQQANLLASLPEITTDFAQTTSLMLTLQAVQKDTAVGSRCRFFSEADAAAWDAASGAAWDAASGAAKAVAWAVAWAAARDDAWDAVWVAGSAVARAAARAIARTAGSVAARDAAKAAAWAAAWDAASASGSAVARAAANAAGAAAWDAAWDAGAAARAAAGNALKPTVAELQAATTDLLSRMIDAA